MSLTINMVGGGGGGLNPSDALIHVNAPLGSTVTFAKGGVAVETITPDKAFANVDGATADYYYPVKSANYGTWTVTATLSGDTASDTVTVNAAEQYDLVLGGYVVRVEKVMTRGRVSTTTDYTGTNFAHSIASYDFVEVHIFRSGVDVGYQVVRVPASSVEFVIPGGSYNYTMALTRTRISCTEYSGNYVNLYVDVYAYHKVV